MDQVLSRVSSGLDKRLTSCFLRMLFGGSFKSARRATHLLQVPYQVFVVRLQQPQLKSVLISIFPNICAENSAKKGSGCISACVQTEEREEDTGIQISGPCFRT